MPALHSSAIAAVSYDAAAMLLHITFHSGGPYTSYRVPAWIYEGLVVADSAGGYYHAHISGRYRP